MILRKFFYLIQNPIQKMASKYKQKSLSMFSYLKMMFWYFGFFDVVSNPMPVGGLNKKLLPVELF